VPDCNVCSSPPLTDLDGKWTLARWNLPPQNGQIRLRPIPNSGNEPIYLQFDKEKNLLSGFAGCNQFFSKLTFDSKGAIVLGTIGSTRKMCTKDQTNELERDLLNILDDYRSWQQNQNQLLLFARSGDVLVFIRHSAK
jgi:heat shock protein HslJ